MKKGGHRHHRQHRRHRRGHHSKSHITNLNTDGAHEGGEILEDKINGHSASCAKLLQFQNIFGKCCFLTWTPKMGR